MGGGQKTKETREAKVFVSEINPKAPEVRQRLENSFYMAYAKMLNNGKPLPKVGGEEMEPRAFISKRFKEEGYPSNMMQLLSAEVDKFVSGAVVVMRSGYEVGKGVQDAAKVTFGGVTGEENMEMLAKELLASFGVRDSGPTTAFADATVDAGHYPIAFSVKTETGDGETYKTVSYNWPKWIEPKPQETKFGMTVPKKKDEQPV